MKNSGSVAQILTHQDAPRFLLRFPRLLYAYYVLNHISALRMKYARRAIRTVLARYPQPHTVVEAGCGLGDFLFTIPAFKYSPHIVGIDLSPSNIAVCTALAKRSGSTNMHFVCSDLGTAELPPEADLILCIGVLMYIRDDAALLRRFHASLKDDGRLLLYVAVNYRRRLGWFRRLSKIHGFDYDDVIGRPQTYTDESLEKRLHEFGFTIEHRQPSFGPFAATMFEISAIFEWYFKSWHPLAAMLLIPFYLCFYPLYLIAMELDVRSPRSTGNGVMIIARKS